MFDVDVAFAYTRGLPDFVDFFANDDDNDDDLRNLSQYGRVIPPWPRVCHMVWMMMMVLLTNVSCHAFIGDDRIGW